MSVTGTGRGGNQAPPDFVVHNASDTVGVVVVETVQPGQALQGWVMDTDGTIEVTAQAAIPLGHKVAIRPIGAGDTIAVRLPPLPHAALSPV